MLFSGHFQFLYTPRWQQTRGEGAEGEVGNGFFRLNIPLHLLQSWAS